MGIVFPMSEKIDRLRGAPYSKESEMMVLGCMLTSLSSLNIGADGLADNDFYLVEHQIVFQVLKAAFKKDRPADVHIVCEELKRMEKLEAVGGASYVATLAQYAGTSAYIEEYVEIVKAKSILRKMIHASQMVEKAAREEPDDVHATLDDAQRLFFHISQSANPGIGVAIADLLSGLKANSGAPYLKDLQERQEKYYERGPSDAPLITGLPTHFLDVDRILNGLGNSHFIILAARPAMGKTAFALNIAESVCFKSDLPVGIFSLEMTSEQLLHRIVCSQAEVESDKIRTGNISGVEFQRIVSTVAHMQKRTMIIDDQPGLKITDLRARARRLKEAHGIRLLIIDYLQLISGSGSSRTMENRQNEISEISRLLKNLARELDIPIICLSQLSRKVEDRTGHRPLMSDLRESGCLAGDTLIQDAHTGTLHTIKELAERTSQTPFPIYAVDEHLKLTIRPLIKAFHSGKKTLFSLKTRTGRSIKASSNHPFLKLEGWTALSKLKPGDRIALPRQFVPLSNAKAQQKDELILLAHLLGDGCILPNQPYHYTSADEENIRIVSETSRRLFNIQSRIVKQKNWHHVYLPSPSHTTKGRYHPITTWFQQLGIERCRSYEKRIPKHFLAMGTDDTALFLKHLWGTDGNISLKTTPGRRASAAIYYASSSQLLATQVQHMLLRVGIQSTLKHHPSKLGYRSMHHVHIQGTPNQIAFLQTVGSSGKRGSLGKELLHKLREIDPNPNCDVIPKEAWQQFVEPAKNNLGIGWREVTDRLQMSYCGSTLFKHGISRSRMHRLHQALNDNCLLTLAQSDVYWDEIISIEELGVEDVYDATVEGVHNFVANDIFVHNSIEQDSDIVMFLLRREYYDPHDKPGMAEVIIAKNRHGGIGNVNLTFIKELAQFRNYTPIHSESGAAGAFADI